MALWLDGSIYLGRSTRQILDDEDDWLFGTGNAEADEEASDAESPTSSAREVQQSADQGAGDDSDNSDVSRDELSSHFLDQQTDANTAARRFVAAAQTEVQAVETMVKATMTGSREASATNTGNRSQLLRCGCDRHCFDFFKDGTIEATRLSILELGKGEREALVLGVLQSCWFEAGKGKLRRYFAIKLLMSML